MSPIELLRQLDKQRRNAMIAADAESLGRLLADDLIWTHSSGATETKTKFIAAIVEGHVAYRELVISRDQIRRISTAVVHQGILTGTASRDGLEKALCAKFLAVWRDVESVGGSMQLTAWQSTNCALSID